MLKASPPKKPSQVFLGEWRSNNLVLPKERPTKYAPVSLDHSKIKNPNG